VRIDEIRAVRDRLVAEHTRQLAQYGDVRLSYWAFSIYNECPQRYILYAVGRHSELAIRKDNYNAVSGSVVHSLIEDMTTEVKAGAIDWDDKDFLSDNVPQYLDKFLAEEPVDFESREIDVVEYKAQVIPLIRNSTRNMYNMLRDEGLIPCDPATVTQEMKFQTPVLLPGKHPPYPGITLTGRADLVFDKGHGIVIVDPKDVEKKGNLNWRQLSWYALGLEPVFGKPVLRAGFLLSKLGEWAWRNPNGKHRGDTRLSREVLWDEILETVLKIRREPFRARLSNFHCPRCEVRDLCPEYYTYAGRQNSILEELEALDEGKVKW
jgi:hypothetical protein